MNFSHINGKACPVDELYSSKNIYQVVGHKQLLNCSNAQKLNNTHYHYKTFLQKRALRYKSIDNDLDKDLEEYRSEWLSLRNKNHLNHQQNFNQEQDNLPEHMISTVLCGFQDLLDKQINAIKVDSNTISRSSKNTECNLLPADEKRAFDKNVDQILFKNNNFGGIRFLNVNSILQRTDENLLKNEKELDPLLMETTSRKKLENSFSTKDLECNAKLPKIKVVGNKNYLSNGEKIREFCFFKSLFFVIKGNEIYI
nr:uncharacterized protein LOC124810899 [Hydra vulgaris]